MIHPFKLLTTILLLTHAAVTTVFAQTGRTPGTGSFALIKTNEEVVGNGRYILVNTAYAAAMKAYEKSKNNYGQVAVTLNEAKDFVTDIPEGTAVFNLIKRDSRYYFWENTNRTYMAITASNDKNNYLRTDPQENELTRTAINIGENAEAAIQFNGNKNYTHNVLRYNGDYNLFSCYTEGNQNLQKPVRLFREVYTRALTPGQYGTLCLPYSGTFSGAKLYTIEGKQMEGDEVVSVSLVETETLERGVPYIFLATGDLLEVRYTGYEAEAMAVNGLGGSYEATAVDEGMYVISQNKVKRCGKNSKIGTNRCYINMDEVPVLAPSAEARVIRFGGTTNGIESIKDGPDSRTIIYNLSGQRVKTAKRGLYIVNGKKTQINK